MIKRTLMTILALAVALVSVANDYDFVVAADGSGDFKSVQEAIDVVPDYCKSRPTTIFIKNGIYKEKITIATSKQYLTLIGESANGVVLTYDDYARKIGRTGAEVGTSGTPTVFIYPDNFCARNITFENNADPIGGQCVAVMTAGNNQTFENCRFLGNQDTIFTSVAGVKQYFKKCYIEGTTDFIFGPSAVLFENCTIHSKRDSYITAASTPEGQKVGYIFLNCTLTAKDGINKVYLGRPWRSFAKTIFVECDLGAHILPEGWHNWSKPDAEKTSYYAEHNNRGKGASTAHRVSWSHQMTKPQVEAMLLEMRDVK